jgi:hypothetical protein
MDMKLKIIIMLFVIVAVGYAIYFIMTDMSNTKKIEKFDKKITEKFENYDLRKQILSQLDTFKIDKNVKSKIYDAMSNNIEQFSDMPEDNVNAFIKDIIKQTKENFKNKKNKKAEAEEEDEDDEKEGFEQAQPSVGATQGVPSVGTTQGVPSVGTTQGVPSVGTTQGVPSVGTTQGVPSVGVTQGPVAALPALPTVQALAPTGMNGATDITNIIDSTVNQVGSIEKNLSQVKSMVAALAQQCGRPSPAGAVTQPVKPPTIEGFENSQNRKYAYIL